MTWNQTAFDSYDIWYYSGNADFWPKSMINLFRGASVVGRLDFYAGNPGRNSLSPDGRVFVSYPLTSFADVVAILRNESPLVVWFDTTSGIGALTTSEQEPVGELEPK